MLSRTHSFCVNVALSFKSAPAQNAVSTLLPRTNALVGPLPFSARIDSTCCDKLLKSCLDNAFLASGLFNKRTRTCPDPAAGICCTFMTDPSALVPTINVRRDCRRNEAVMDRVKRLGEQVSSLRDMLGQLSVLLS